MPIWGIKFVRVNKTDRNEETNTMVGGCTVFRFASTSLPCKQDEIEIAGRKRGWSKGCKLLFLPFDARRKCKPKNDSKNKNAFSPLMKIFNIEPKITKSFSEFFHFRDILKNI